MLQKHSDTFKAFGFLWFLRSEQNSSVEYFFLVEPGSRVVSKVAQCLRDAFSHRRESADSDLGVVEVKLLSRVSLQAFLDLACLSTPFGEAFLPAEGRTIVDMFVLPVHLQKVLVARKLVPVGSSQEDPDVFSSDPV